MADLPFELQKLPESALDVLRYFGHNDNMPSDDVMLADETGLSDRSLGKAIKRLVTRKFAEMDVHRQYQLTTKGLQLMEKLLAWDEKHGANPKDEEETAVLEEPVECHISVVLPQPLVATLPTPVYVGVEDGLPEGEATLVLRVTTLNAEPESVDIPLTVTQGDAYTSFELTPGEFTSMRVRLEVLQADNYSGDMHEVGGMYVDVDVTNEPEEAGQLTAYGADVIVTP